MQFLLETLSLLAFFGSYWLTKNMFIATIVCTIFAWVQLLLNKLIYKKYNFTQLISAVIITVFSLLALLTGKKIIIMIKPTILYLLFAIILLVADKFGKNLLKSLLGQQFQLSDTQWRFLMWVWVIVLSIIACVNVIVALYCSDFIWVKFKLIAGIMSMIFLALISSVYCLVKKEN